MLGFGKFFQLGHSVNSFFLRKSLQNYIQINGFKSSPSFLSTGLPPKPKRPTPAFVLFVNKVREELQQQQQNVKSTEVLKIAGQKWKNLDSSYKTSLKEEYKKQFLIYKQEMQQYKNDLPPEQQNITPIKSSRKNDKVKDRDAPKKPLTSFFIFMKEQVPKEKAMNVNMSQKEIISKVSQLWRQLPEEEKQKYVLLSQKHKEEFKQALIRYEETKKNTE